VALRWRTALGPGLLRWRTTTNSNNDNKDKDNNNNNGRRDPGASRLRSFPSARLTTDSLPRLLQHPLAASLVPACRRHQAGIHRGVLPSQPDLEMVMCTLLQLRSVVQQQCCIDGSGDIAGPHIPLGRRDPAMETGPVPQCLCLSGHES